MIYKRSSYLKDYLAIKKERKKQDGTVFTDWSCFRNLVFFLQLKHNDE